MKPYIELDKDTEELFPIDPANETRITASELRRRNILYYNYPLIKEWVMQGRQDNEQ